MATRRTLIAVAATGAVGVVTWRRHRKGRRPSALRVGVFTALVAGGGFLTPRAAQMAEWTSASTPPPGQQGDTYIWIVDGVVQGIIFYDTEAGWELVTSAPPATGGGFLPPGGLPPIAPVTGTGDTGLLGSIESYINEGLSTIGSVTSDLGAAGAAAFGSVISTITDIGGQAIGVVGHLLSTALSDIESFVRSIVSIAIRLYDEYIEPIFAGILHAYGRLLGTMESIFGEVLTLAQKAYNLEDRLVTSIYHDAINAAEQIGHLVEVSVKLYVDGIIALVMDTVNAVRGAFNVAYHNIILPTWHFIDGIEQWMQNFLAAWWDRIWAHVFGPVWSEMLRMIHDVPGILDWLVTKGYHAVELVIACAEWLGWMAVHSFEDITHLWGMSPEHWAKEIIRTARSDLSGVGDEAEQYLTDLLGA